MTDLFRAILADPAWSYNDLLTMSAVKRGAASQYTTMTVQQICDMYAPSRVERHGMVFDKKVGHLHRYPIADTAILGLWTTAPMLLDGIPQRVCLAWGFTPKQIVPWIKGRLAIDQVDRRPVPRLVIQPGMGNLTRVCVEYLLLATRGKYTQLVKSHSENGLLLADEDALILAPKSQHSRKPDEQYSLIERLFPGPYLELFAQRPREGWTSSGAAVNGDEYVDPAAPQLALIAEEGGVLPEPPVSWS